MKLRFVDPYEFEPFDDQLLIGIVQVKKPKTGLDQSITSSQYELGTERSCFDQNKEASLNLSANDNSGFDLLQSLAEITPSQGQTSQNTRGQSL